MSALYERSQLTQMMISSAPATAETMEKAEYLRLDCTIRKSSSPPVRNRILM